MLMRFEAINNVRAGRHGKVGRPKGSKSKKKKPNKGAKKMKREGIRGLTDEETARAVKWITKRGIGDPPGITLSDRDPGKNDTETKEFGRFEVAHQWINEKNTEVFLLESLHKGVAKWCCVSMETKKKDKNQKLK